MRNARSEGRPSDPTAARPSTKSRDGQPAADNAGDSRPPAAPPQLRYHRPGTARYIARVLIKHAMDYDAAITEITRYWGLTPAQIADYADKCEQSAEVQAAIKLEMEQAGLSEDFKNEYLRVMKSWLYTGCEAERLKAATVFGKGFVGEKVSSDKPVSLPLEGMEGGLKRMLREDAVEPGAAAPSVLDEEDENEVIN